jgi:two-component system, NarL family, response regulator LiaR
MADILQPITNREKEVLTFLSKGMTYKEIAEKMEVSSETVKKHLKNIYRKLNVQNKIGALNRAKLL